VSTRPRVEPDGFFSEKQTLLLSRVTILGHKRVSHADMNVYIH